MFENIAAIDIGTSTIKLVTVKTGFQDFQLKSFLYEEIDFTIEDKTEALNNSLKDLIEKENLKGYKIITNLPMEKTIIRNITFPFNDPEKIAEAIPYEAEEDIPFKIDDLTMDFQSLMNETPDEGRILLAATHKENMHDFLSTLTEHNISPVFMGMESNSLFECYKYFSEINEETVLQIDIGNNKTIINIIKNRHLVYTRSISIGIDTIHSEISNILKCKYSDAIKIFARLNLDLTSLENNVQRGYYKEIKLKKSELKKIFTTTSLIIDELIEQIVLTIKSYTINDNDLLFSRALISGGGANLTGLTTVFSKEFEIPVVSHPFLDEYKNQIIQTQFVIAFGMILAFLNKKKGRINFLKGEFIPDIVRSTKKIYYLAAGFLIASILVLIINFISSVILTNIANDKYNDIITKKFKVYFSTKETPKNPIAEANKLLANERKNIQSIKELVSRKKSSLEMLRDIISAFPGGDENFNLKSIVINKSIIRIDGHTEKSQYLDEFKEKLNKKNIFNSISLNIRNSKRNITRFTLTIKHKKEEEDKKTKKRAK